MSPTGLDQPWLLPLPAAEQGQGVLPVVPRRQTERVQDLTILVAASPQVAIPPLLGQLVTGRDAHRCLRPRVWSWLLGLGKTGG